MAGAVLLTLIFLSKLLLNWSDLWFWMAIGAVFYGLIAPLIVSAYVYDYSGYYNFDWLAKYDLIDTDTLLLVSINAGFDETSFSIKDRFPRAQLRVFDFYNKQQEKLGHCLERRVNDRQSIRILCNKMGCSI